MFATGDSCNHSLYRFTGLGDDEVLPSMESGSKELVKFCPKVDLQHFDVVEEVSNFSGINDMICENLLENSHNS